jgi:hypothetical protein
MIRIFRNTVILIYLLSNEPSISFSQIFPDRVIFSTAGKDLKNSIFNPSAQQNNKITFTLGEPIILVTTIQGKKLNGGFIQPDGIYPVSPSINAMIIQNDPFQIYPNPINDYTNVKSPELWEGNVDIQLIDSQGKLLQTYQMENSNFQIDFENQLAPGNYYLSFYNQQGQLLQRTKLIKIK